MLRSTCAEVRRRFGAGRRCNYRARTNEMLWVPSRVRTRLPVLSEKAHVLYKATDFYAPEYGTHPHLERSPPEDQLADRG